MAGTRFDQDVGSPSAQRVIQITDTPTKVFIKSLLYKTLEIYNADPNNTIYFGDANVTSAT